MAQKRLLDKKISISEQVANLTKAEAALTFTWSIPHADDIGLLPCNPRSLKAMIVPMMPWTLEEFIGYVEMIVEQGLWVEVEYEGQKFYRLPGFSGHQTLKKDRQPQTLLKFDHASTPKQSWAKLEDIGFHTEDTGFQLEDIGNQTEQSGIHLEAESNRTEEKGKEENTERGKNAAPEDILANAADFIRFFSEATGAIRGIKPIIDGGKDGSLIKTRLSDIKGNMPRLEKMTVWYLSRTKRVKVEVPGKEVSWRDEYKNPPAIATMLSTSYFNQLLSEEHNATTYMTENMATLERIYHKAIAPPKLERIVDLKSLLAKRFTL